MEMELHTQTAANSVHLGPLVLVEDFDSLLRTLAAISSSGPNQDKINTLPLLLLPSAPSQV